MPQPQDDRVDPLVIPAIAVGGAAGASLRHLVEVWLPSGPADWPWATLLVNLLGALAMGVLMGILAARNSHTSSAGTAAALVRPFVGVGLLGGFTTMSTQALGTVQLVQSGQGLSALGYAAGTAIGAVALAGLGWALTSRLRSRPRPVTPSPSRTGTAAGLLVMIMISIAVVVAAALAGVGGAVGWVVLGAAVGAPLRHLTGRLVQTWHSSDGPWGTLTVNVLGSLILGLLVATSGPVALLAGTGFCGAYTTWSTTAQESASLLRHGRRGLGLGYPIVSVVLCALACGLGVVLL